MGRPRHRRRRDATGTARSADPSVDVHRMGARYVGSSDPRLPGISPVYGDMTGLPPIVMHTAGDDPISFDADKIETACAASKTASLTTGGSTTCGTTSTFRSVCSPKHATRSPTSARNCATTSHRKPPDPQRKVAPNELIRRQSRRHHRSRLRHRQGPGPQSCEKGAQLALSDIDADGLSETVRQAQRSART